MKNTMKNMIRVARLMAIAAALGFAGVAEAKTSKVTTFAELKAAIQDSTVDVIDVAANIDVSCEENASGAMSVTKTATLSVSRDLLIQGKDAHVYTIKRTGSTSADNHRSILEIYGNGTYDGVSVSFKNIVFDGGAVWEAGSTPKTRFEARGSKYSHDYYGKSSKNSGIAGRSVIDVANKGTLNLESGAVVQNGDCTCNAHTRADDIDNDSSTYCYGGGIRVECYYANGGGTINIKSGAVIQDCEGGEGGGVGSYNLSRVNIYGGTIRRCGAQLGGGVGVTWGTTAYNNGASAGGESKTHSGVISCSGGIFEDCWAKEKGGALAIEGTAKDCEGDDYYKYSRVLNLTAKNCVAEDGAALAIFDDANTTAYLAGSPAVTATDCTGSGNYTGLGYTTSSCIYKDSASTITEITSIHTLSFVDGADLYGQVDVEHGRSAGAMFPADPARTGMVFTEWRTNLLDSASKITKDTVINSDVTAYAYWVSVKVSLDDATVPNTTYQVLLKDSPITPDATGKYFVPSNEQNIVVVYKADDGYYFEDGTTEKTNAVITSTNPATVKTPLPSAASNHKHCICGTGTCAVGGHTHADIVWAEWTSTTALPTSAGNYYLANDVTLTAEQALGDGVNLCLNGHTVKQTTSGKRVMKVVNDGSVAVATFTLTDCAGTGAVTGGTNSDRGAGIYVTQKDVSHTSAFNFYGGIFRGNAVESNAKDKANGGGVAIDINCKCYMYGGVISNNTATVNSNQPGAGRGGGVFVYGGSDGVGEMYIYGGDICYNTANRYGGGIEVGSGSDNDHPKLTIGGTARVFGNKAHCGGGISCDTGSQVTITGGEIFDNKATEGVIPGSDKGTGGGLYLYAGPHSISNCVIYNNSAAVHGGGLCLDPQDTVTIGGTVIVTNNTVGGTIENAYITTDKKFTLSSLASDSKIGVTTKTAAEPYAPVTFATNAVAANVASFTSDNPAYYVKLEGGNLVLSVPNVKVSEPDPAIANTSFKVLTNGVEVAKVSGEYLVPSNSTIKVVYTAADGYYFADGSTAITNTITKASTNPVVDSSEPAAPQRKDYYVSSTGSDANIGSPTAPFATITNAIVKSAGRKTTIRVMTDLVQDPFDLSKFGVANTTDITITSDDNDPATTDDRFVIYPSNDGSVTFWTLGQGDASSHYFNAALCLTNIVLDGRIGGSTGTTKFGMGAIKVIGNGTTTLADGFIVRNFQTAEGNSVYAIVEEHMGKLYIREGALLTSNTIRSGQSSYTSNAQGVINIGGNAGLYMTGGLIAGNTATGTASSMINLGTGCAAYLTGGAISNNVMYASDSYACYKRMKSSTEANASDYYFGGTIIVSDNKDTNGKQKNVHIPSGSTAHLSAAMTGDAKIGLYIVGEVAGELCVADGADYEPVTGDTAHIAMDRDANYHVFLKDADKKIYIARHSWTYAVDSGHTDTLYAYCPFSGCPYSGSASDLSKAISIKLVTPDAEAGTPYADAYLDGTNVWFEAGLTNPPLSYATSGSSSYAAAAPSNYGDYIAKATISNDLYATSTFSLTSNVVFVEVKVADPMPDNTTFKVYTNGVEIAKTGGKYLVVSNSTDVTVVFEADDGYFFDDGTTEKTNTVDTSTNPATVNGTAPRAPQKPLEYTAPVYVDNIASNGIAYWTTNKCYSYTVVTSAASQVTWGAAGVTNWLAVTNDVEITGGVVCKGDVNLILCEGAKLTVKDLADNNAGIATDASGSFTIYGQPDGAGELEAFGGNRGAGIGGGQGVQGKNITINGGKVSATGGNRGAGIGGGSSGDGSNITINGGKVTATGGSGGAGIGGSGSGMGIGITINGGTITAHSGDEAPCIGGGVDATCRDIVIRAGTLYLVEAYRDRTGVWNAYIGCGTDCYPAPGVEILPEAKLFFSLDYGNTPPEVKFDGNVIMTRGTQTVSQVLVDGIASATTFTLTNMVSGATTNIVTDGPEVTFAHTYCWLTNDNGRLVFMIRKPELWVDQQPHVTNSYGIVAATDGNNDITNYVWSVKNAAMISAQDTIAVITNVNSESMIANGTTIMEKSGNATNMQFVVHTPGNDQGYPGLPIGGKLRFTCSQEVKMVEGGEYNYGTITRVGTDEWVYDPNWVEIKLGWSYCTIAIEAAEVLSINVIGWETSSYSAVAEGADMTALPFEKGVAGSTYVCQMTYGHEGFYYTADSEEFLFLGTIGAIPTPVKHTTWSVYTNGFVSAEDDGVWAAWTNENATVVYKADDGYYFPGMVTEVTNSFDTSKNPAYAPAPDAPVQMVVIEFTEPENTTVTVTTNDAPIEKVGDSYYVPSNAAPTKVIVEANLGHVFSDGATVKTNNVDTSKNPATIDGGMPAAAFIPVATVTTNAVTTFYGNIISAWDDACAEKNGTASTLKLLKDVKLSSVLSNSGSYDASSSLTIDLNDCVISPTNEYDDTLLNLDATRSVSIVDNATTKSNRYFTVREDGLWVLTNEVTELSVKGGLITGSKVSAIKVYNGSITLRGIAFVGNQSLVKSGSGYGGGALRIDDAKANIYDVKFLGNAAEYEGGAIRANLGVKMLIKGCQFRGNRTDREGGAIFTQNKCVLIDTVIDGNCAGKDGGGVNFCAKTSCLAAGTKIAMADGSERNIEEIGEGDLVKTFDHEGGTNAVATVYLCYRGENLMHPFVLSFASGKTLAIVDRHDLLEQDTRKYVTITAENAAEFVGKSFYAADGSWDELVAFERGNDPVEFYSIYTTHHLNCYANGLLSVADDVDFYLNIYELDENLKADAAQLAADIAEFGLMKISDYAKLEGMEVMFDSLNVKYTNVSVGKGLLTMSYFWSLFDATDYPDEKPAVVKVPKLAKSPKLGGAAPEPKVDDYESYGKGVLVLGANTVITNNITTNGVVNNLYLGASSVYGKPMSLVALDYEHDGLNVGVTRIDGVGQISTVTNVTAADVALFTSDSTNYVTRLGTNGCLRLALLSLVAPTNIEHTSFTIYTNGVPIEESSIIVPDDIPTYVVYEPIDDYIFPDGETSKTNEFDISVNPAEMQGVQPEPASFLITNQTTLTKAITALNNDAKHHGDWYIGASFTVSKSVAIYLDGIDLLIRGNGYVLTATQSGGEIKSMFDLRSQGPNAATFRVEDLDVVVSNGFRHAFDVMRDTTMSSPAPINTTFDDVDVKMAHSGAVVIGGNVKPCAAFINNYGKLTLTNGCSFALNTNCWAAIDLTSDTGMDATLTIESGDIEFIEGRTNEKIAVEPLVVEDDGKGGTVTITGMEKTKLRWIELKNNSGYTYVVEFPWAPVENTTNQVYVGGLEITDVPYMLPSNAASAYVVYTADDGYVFSNGKAVLTNDIVTTTDPATAAVPEAAFVAEAMVTTNGVSKWYSAVITAWKAALAARPVPATVTLLRDVAVTNTMKIADEDANVTFDLNDHVLNGAEIPQNDVVYNSPVFQISSGKAFAVVDNAANGTTKYFTTNNDGLWVITNEVTELAVTGGVITAARHCAIYQDGWAAAATKLAVRDITFAGNRSEYAAPAININYCTGVVENVRFIGNICYCSGVNAGGAIGGGYSGYFDTAYPKFILTGCEIVSNQALYSSGGGIFIEANATLEMNDCRIFGNSAASSGGGIYCESDYEYFGTCVKLTMTDCVVASNQACNGFGGGIGCYGATKLMMVDCQVCNNTAGVGGGIYKDDDLDEGQDKFVLIGTTVTGNSASTSGAGIYYKNIGSCFAAGTMITMADGSVKAVEDVAEGDLVLAFDHEGGTNAAARVYMAYKGSSKSMPFTLEFDDDTTRTLSIVGCHDLLEQESRKYVTITAANAGKYIGSKFYGEDGQWHTLTGVSRETEAVEYYSLYSAQYQNIYANGMLTVADDVDYILNLYELDENLKADAAQLEADIEEYGLVQFATINTNYGTPREWFEATNGKYYYVAMGKGLVTREYLAQIFGTTGRAEEPTEEKMPKLAKSPKLGSAPKLSFDDFDTDLLTLGAGTTVTNNFAGGAKSNIYLENDSLIKLAADHSGVSAGVTTITTPEAYAPVAFTTNGAAADVALFTSDNPCYEVRLLGSKLVLSVPDVTFTPKAVEFTEVTVYTNDAPVAAVSEGKYLIPSNATAHVVYTVTEEGYHYADGTRVVTNDITTSTEPATAMAPVVPMRKLEYTKPVYVDNVASNGIAYWTTNTVYDYTVVTSAASAVTWGAASATKWFAVTNADVQIKGGVVCKGHVNLILCEGAKLFVTNASGTAGIATDKNGSFTIYGQPDGAGELEVFGGENCAGIGCNQYCGESGKNITINGGTVTANGGGSGIGGGAGSIGENITINGGTVEANGGESGAGIGGGSWGGSMTGGTNITINGGIVIANGGNFCAGIGGGGSGFGSYITINGGKVTANGGDYGAGIGGGTGGAGSNIAINGGVVMANGGAYATGIGGGSDGAGSNITINNAVVFAGSPIGFSKGSWVIPDIIGNGADCTTAASGCVIDPSAKIFFNLTGFYDFDNGVWLEEVAPMPTTFEGFTVMTPETQTVERVLVGGCANWTAATTFTLTNAAIAATETIKVNGVDALFAERLLSLTHADSKLTLTPYEYSVIEKPVDVNHVISTVYTNDAAVAVDPELAVRKDSPAFITYVTEADYCFEDGTTAVTNDYDTSVSPATVAEAPRIIVQWEDEREIPFDSRERILVTTPEEVLPISLFTNIWTAIGGEREKLSLTVSNAVTGASEKLVNIVSPNIRSLGYIVHWQPIEGEYAPYVLTYTVENNVGDEVVTNATIYYTREFPLTINVGEGGTAVVTNSTKTLASGDDVLAYDLVTVVPTPYVDETIHYQVKSITVTDDYTSENVEVSEDYVFEMPLDPATLDVQFKIQKIFTKQKVVYEGESWEPLPDEEYENGILNYGTVILRGDIGNVSITNYVQGTNIWDYTLNKTPRLSRYDLFVNEGGYLRILVDDVITNGEYEVAANAEDVEGKGTFVIYNTNTLESVEMDVDNPPEEGEEPMLGDHSYSLVHTADGRIVMKVDDAYVAIFNQLDLVEDKKIIRRKLQDTIDYIAMTTVDYPDEYMSLDFIRDQTVYGRTYPAGTHVDVSCNLYMINASNDTEVVERGDIADTAVYYYGEGKTRFGEGATIWASTNANVYTEVYVENDAVITNTLTVGKDVGGTAETGKAELTFWGDVSFDNDAKILILTNGIVRSFTSIAEVNLAAPEGYVVFAYTEEYEFGEPINVYVAKRVAGAFVEVDNDDTVDATAAEAAAMAENAYFTCPDPEMAAFLAQSHAKMAEYQALFDCRADVVSADKAYKLVTYLTDEAKAEIKAALDAANASLLTPEVRSHGSLTVETKPGIYYAVFEGDTPKAAQQISDWVGGQGGSMRLDFTPPALHDKKFFTIRAATTLPFVPAEMTLEDF